MDLNRQKRVVAGLSVLSNTILVIGKFAVGIMINSVSIISEAVHSGIDLIASVVAFIAVREASKPPDKEHPFGHGKVEAISGAFEGMLIFLAVIIIVYESIAKIKSGGEIIRLDIGMAIMGISAIMNAIVSWQLFKTAKKTESLALEADALHLSTDVITSLAVFAGLLLIRITGVHLLDPITALIVALVICRSAYGIVRKSFKDLMDENLSAEELGCVKNTLENHYKHFVEFHDLRSRKSGNIREIDLHLVQCRKMTLDDAHAVCDHLEEELQKKISRAHITIHVEPCDLNCEKDRDTCQLGTESLASHIQNDNDRRL